MIGMSEVFVMFGFATWISLRIGRLRIAAEMNRWLSTK